MAASEPFTPGTPPLFTVNESVAESLTGHRPVLLNLLDGFVDGGQVIKTISETVLEHCEHEPLVVFDHDQVHDYRSRRPLITFDTVATETPALRATSVMVTRPVMVPTLSRRNRYR